MKKLTPLRHALYTLLVASLCMSAGELADADAAVAAPDASRAALLVMDMQVDFLAADGRYPVAPSMVDGMLASTNALLDRAASLGIEVAYIGNEYKPWDLFWNLVRHGAAMQGSDGARLDPRLHHVTRHYFAKDQNDAFSNPGLNRFLLEQKVGQLLIAGVYTNACVFDTAREALKHGYQVTVLSDAVAAGDERVSQESCDRLLALGARVTTARQLLSDFAR